MSGYPDDIRDYDRDPRSPFYDNSEELALEDRTNEIEKEILADRELLCEAFAESGMEMQTCFINAVLIASINSNELRGAINALAGCYAITMAKQEFSE